MTTVTVLALDSSLAMDEVVRQLGENAYILSTRHRDGQVEICATNEPVPDAKAPPKVRVETPSFQAVLERSSAGHTLAPIPAKGRASLRSVEGGAPPPQAPQPSPDLADEAQIRAAADKLTEALAVLNEMLPQTEAPQPSAFERAGFAPDLVGRHNPKGLPGKSGDEAVRLSLSRALIDPVPMALFDAATILVMGPSGGGKTVLAGKIAALLRETQPERPLMLATLSAEPQLAPGALAAYARLLGVKHEACLSESTDVLDDARDGTCRIVEVNLDGAPLDKLLASLRTGTQKHMRAVVALPTGSSPERVRTALEKYRTPTSTIALCKLDECELSPREISAIAGTDMQIAWLSGTRSLTGNLAPATIEMMGEFLEGLVLGQA